MEDPWKVKGVWEDFWDPFGLTLEGSREAELV